MAVSLRVGRTKQLRRPAKAKLDSGPSVREVCLVAVDRGLSGGDRVTWSGRVYRVESTHPRAVALGGATSRPTPPTYAYLAPALEAGIATGT